MKPLNECLDILLKRLADNWNNYGNDRKYLSCEEMMTIFEFNPQYRKHEFFEGLIDKLREDKYAEFIDENQRSEKDKITFYQQNTIITVMGWYFIQNGGYVQKKIHEDSEYNNQKAQAKATLLLTAVLALGTVPMGLLAFADLYHKYKWFQDAYSWWIFGLAFVVGAATSYAVTKLLNRKR